MNIKFEKHNKNDIHVIKWQLNSSEAFPGGIVERCDFGYPRIILLSPECESETSCEIRLESITNLIWLTCPYLNERIHSLESDRNIPKIANFINQDSYLFSVMQNAHSHFYFLRKYVYGKFLNFPIPGEWRDLFETGIGGVRCTSYIKCLHLHFSHFRLCNYNVVGLITFYLLNRKMNCDGEMCKNAK
jgi:hypothetical protein